MPRLLERAVALGGADDAGLFASSRFGSITLPRSLVRVDRWIVHRKAPSASAAEGEAPSRRCQNCSFTGGARTPRGSRRTDEVRSGSRCPPERNTEERARRLDARPAGAAGRSRRSRSFGSDVAVHRHSSARGIAAAGAGHPGGRLNMCWCWVGAGSAEVEWMSLSLICAASTLNCAPRELPGGAASTPSGCHRQKSSVQSAPSAPAA